MFYPWKTAKWLTVVYNCSFLTITSLLYLFHIYLFNICMCVCVCVCVCIHIYIYIIYIHIIQIIYIIYNIIYLILYIYIYIYIYTQYISSHKWSMTQRVLKSHRSKMSIIYVIMKTMCPPSYHHSGFVATYALGHMINNHTCVQVHELPQSHCDDNREGTLFSLLHI